MQNNAADLTHRLLRALDSNYNVVDMHSVVEIISLLEKVAITKELLETTRLGKHVNELRRNTTNESLAKRAKELVKKWRSMVLPDTNGQAKVASDVEDAAVTLKQAKKRPNRDGGAAMSAAGPPVGAKRARLNGQSAAPSANSELDLSDNSNSSFKDLFVKQETPLQQPPPTQQHLRRDVILINSDSNSSIPEVKQEAPQVVEQQPQPQQLLQQQAPKKRGRKKGSKNHRNLLDEAETSFTNKMAVSRGNAKVKTTQELVAGLQSKCALSATTAASKQSPAAMDDLSERAAKLTERVSIIDQKLNTNSNRYKNSQRRGKAAAAAVGRRSPEPGAAKGGSSTGGDDEIIVVDDATPPDEPPKPEATALEAEHPGPTLGAKSLSVEECLEQLPPIDRGLLDDDEPEILCSCRLAENKGGGGDCAEDADACADARLEFFVDRDCPARAFLVEKYRLSDEASEAAVRRLHAKPMPNVNGNYGACAAPAAPSMNENGLYDSVVPDLSAERLPRHANFYYREKCKNEVGDDGVALDASAPTDRNSNLTAGGGDVSDGDGDDDGDGGDCEKLTFREWHEVVEAPSYGGELLRILPYVIID